MRTGEPIESLLSSFDLELDDPTKNAEQLQLTITSIRDFVCCIYNELELETKRFQEMPDADKKRTYKHIHDAHIHAGSSLNENTFGIARQRLRVDNAPGNEKKL